MRIKASLLRDTPGQFRISLLEDEGGIYFNKIETTDVCDDRERLQHRDYLVSISRRPAGPRCRGRRQGRGQARQVIPRGGGAPVCARARLREPEEA